MKLRNLTSVLCYLDLPEREYRASRKACSLNTKSGEGEHGYESTYLLISSRNESMARLPFGFGTLLGGEA